MRQWGIVAGLALYLLGLGRAGAQHAESAAELFERGVSALQQGQPELGCAALDESYRLDPQPGALFAAATCHATWGKVHRALQRYRTYVMRVPSLSAAQQARHAERLELARAAIKRLSSQLPTLELVLPDAGGASFIVTLDGERLTAAALAQPLPVDPGSHTIETTSVTGARWQTTFDVGVGEHPRIALRVPAAPAALMTPPAVTPPVSSLPAPTEPALAVQSLSAERESAWLSSRSLGWALCGVAAAGLMVGAVAGVSVLSQKAIHDDECGGGSCSPRGMKANERGETWAIVADASLGVAVVSAVAGVVLLLDSDTSSTEAVVPAHGDTAHWQPLVKIDTSGAWLGVSQRW